MDSPRTSSSTIRYESRTTIDRNIEEVFERLADLPAYSSWMHRTGLFRRSGQISGGPMKKGTAYFDATRMGTYRGQVTEFERPSRIGFRETLQWFGSLMEARPEYFLEADQERTIVRHVAEGQLFGWTRLMKPVAALMAKSERARTLESLRRSLESD
jgi:uncharacterized protein YndB with AHSA1/START domain